MSQVVCNGTDKKMAESKSSMLAKSVSKHAGRAKEKLLQNLGKVDRTEDEIFDDHLQNFTKQQNNANRLQKEFNNYIRCIRAVQAASKTLMDCLNEMYESGWLGHELLYTQSQNIEILWNDFSHKLADQVLIPLNTYQAQFPEMRKKIEKRGRKLVDFDSQRHHAQSLQASTNSAKKKDEVKMAKVREQLEEAKRTYEMLNSELHDELPALYDSRVLFLVTNLQTYFAAEQIFHSESSKVFGELEAIVDRLATDCQRSSYAIRKPYSPKPIMNHANDKLTSPSSSHGSVNDENTSCSETPAVNSEPEKENDIIEKASSLVNGSLGTPTTVLEDGVKELSESASSVPNDVLAESDKEVPKSTNSAVTDPTSVTVVISSSNDVKSVTETAVITNGAVNDNLPPGVLYKVRATYKYTQEDVDELSFEVGEIIRVVEYDDPEEQEEGWLMGIKESTGEKGMFPANFTRPL